MSGVEGDVVQEVQAEPAVAPAAPASMTREEALRDTLKQALYKRGLARGLRETVKALDNSKKISVLCVLASDCDESGYVALVEALCKREEIPLIRDVDKLTLGEWCGLCKLDMNGEAVKVNGCSSCVVKVTGAPTSESPSAAFDFLMSNLSASA